eukprot:5373099-Alexandrium_andersonii.AAC.1
MGLLPARATRSEIGRTPHACQGSMNRISSARADATSSGPNAVPVMSPRYVLSLIHISEPTRLALI